MPDCGEGDYESGCLDPGDAARGAFVGAVLVGAVGGVVGAGVAGRRVADSFLAGVGALLLASAAAVTALVGLAALIVLAEP